MSIVSEALRNRETRSGVKRTVVGVVNSFETFEGAGLFVRRPFAKRRRDPIEEARNRVRAQRRAAARIPTLGGAGEARQDDETARPEDAKKLVNS